jgi:multisubunit Na+/H+ antiporter MnhF subunit
MKTYIVSTGIVFGLLTLAHLWRIVEEPHLASDPWFILVTIVAAALTFTAWRVARRPKTSS